MSLRIVSKVFASVVVGFIMSWSDMVAIGVDDGQSRRWQSMHVGGGCGV